MAEMLGTLLPRAVATMRRPPTLAIRIIAEMYAYTSDRPGTRPDAVGLMRAECAA